MLTGKRFMLGAGVLILFFSVSYTTVGIASPTNEPYAWRNVVIGGGGFVTGIIVDPQQKGLMYARTDVGGAYRWDDSTKCWIPLTDWIGAADVNLTGIESLAVDPSDSNRVYLAAGTYTRSQAAILRSDDQGKTFQRTDVPFGMGANETGRFNGERLAVDPNDGAILFFGSRQDGLWKSNDHGTTWSKVAGFPIFKSQPNPTDNTSPRFRFRQQAVGIVCVVFDSHSGSYGHPTPVIYAGVSISTTNLFRSTDCGVTWQAVPDQPIGLRPNHAVLGLDGVMYLTYGNEPGPNIMTDGAVWKLNTHNDEWTDITPVKPSTADQPFGYGDVAVDAAHPKIIMATTFCHWHPHDEIFRSTNSGASWTQIWQDNTTWDHSSAPYTEDINPHWLGSIQIDPFDQNHVLFGTGYGIWSCDDLTGADSGMPIHWTFTDTGLEETVPLDLISPPEGAHLLSGLGDIDGFRHDDLNISPPEGMYKAPAHFVNTESIAFAAENPSFTVRAGTTRMNNKETHGAYSTDGGKTWSLFATDPPESAGAGTITVSANGKIVVWTPRWTAPFFSSDNGRNWMACGHLSRGLRVVADPVNSNKFYAFDSRVGRFYVSTNGAMDFAASEAKLPMTFTSGNRFGIGADGGIVCVASAREGDIWLSFRNNGLYHSTDSGETFSRLNSAQQANSLGFGKAAPGGNYPALYLIGEVCGVQGVFRSDDNGKNWKRINDDQHQFGRISHVTGDPRVYGRVYFATSGRGIIYGDPK